MTETEKLVQAQIKKYEKPIEEDFDSSLDNADLAFAKNLKDALSKELFGQNEAIDAVVNSMRNDITEKKKAPRETYLFL